MNKKKYAAPPPGVVKKYPLCCSSTWGCMNQKNNAAPPPGVVKKIPSTLFLYLGSYEPKKKMLLLHLGVVEKKYPLRYSSGWGRMNKKNNAAPPPGVLKKNTLYAIPLPGVA